MTRFSQARMRFSPRFRAPRDHRRNPHPDRKKPAAVRQRPVSGENGPGSLGLPSFVLSTLFLREESMSRKSWILGALLATVVATPLPRASAAGAAETVAVNFVSLTIPFYLFMRNEAEDEAKKLNIKLLVQDAQFGTPKQGSDL